MPRSLSPLFRNGLIGGAALLVIWAERRRRARRRVEPLVHHTARNLAMAGMAAATVQLLEAPIVMPLARAVERHRLGLTFRVPGPQWLRDAAAVVMLDYTLYVWHVLNHRVPWLWRFHLAHHVDLDMDASTGLRFHAGELALSVPWRAAQIVAIGVTPRALGVWQTITLASVLFHHSNTRLSVTVERALARACVTPRMHATHHAADEDVRASNFSSGLSAWDRVHGTFAFDADAHEGTVGVAGHDRPDDVGLLRVLALPFERLDP